MKSGEHSIVGVELRYPLVLSNLEHRHCAPRTKVFRHCAGCHDPGLSPCVFGAAWNRCTREPPDARECLGDLLEGLPLVGLTVTKLRSFVVDDEVYLPALHHLAQVRRDRLDPIVVDDVIVEVHRQELLACGSVTVKYGNRLVWKQPEERLLPHLIHAGHCAQYKNAVDLLYLVQVVAGPHHSSALTGPHFVQDVTALVRCAEHRGLPLVGHWLVFTVQHRVFVVGAHRLEAGDVHPAVAQDVPRILIVRHREKLDPFVSDDLVLRDQCGYFFWVLKTQDQRLLLGDYKGH